MSKAGLKFVIAGIIVIVFTCFYDLIAGKGIIVLGPKSYTMLVIGTLLIIIGAVFFRKK